MTPSHQGPAADVAELLYALQRFTVETDRFVETLGRLHGMHRTDLNALNAVISAERGGRRATPGTLGTELQLSSPATTALVDRLEKAGHLQRRRSRTDRRRVELEATDAARTVGSRIFGPLAERMGHVVATRSPGEVELLAAFMAELSDSVARTRREALEIGRDRDPDPAP